MISPNDYCVLLLNLGTPDNTSVSGIRKYLRQFLMDKYVINLPWLFRSVIVYLFILPFRPKRTALAYKKIWSSDGSPLLVHSKALAEKLAIKSNLDVFLAMRYGNPTIYNILKKISAKGYKKVFVLPLYPQNADSTIKTALLELLKQAKKVDTDFQFSTIEPYYSKVEFITSLASSIDVQKIPASDFLLFSYHGLPKSHILKQNQKQNTCLDELQCCDNLTVENEFCYRAQAFYITRKTVEQLGRNKNFATTFQSRLGKTEWLRPYTVDFVKQLPQKGFTSLVIVCPSFATDCLETLEEVAIQIKHEFINSGGKKFTLVPCLNDADEWIKYLSEWSQHSEKFYSIADFKCHIF